MTKKHDKLVDLVTPSRPTGPIAHRVKGMKDIQPGAYPAWEFLLQSAGRLARLRGFERIDTPVLESYSLYERSSGRTSDIVTKEMYSFLDKSGERLALRPEATPGIVRAYIEHGWFNLPQPVKTLWYGPLFRRDKPQLGRYRQHYQLNFDIFGEPGPLAEVELIFLIHELLNDWGIEAQIDINSLGCVDCRPNYINELVKYYKEKKHREQLCPDCRKRLIKNPLRLLDCKEPACEALAQGAPQLIDFLCEPCKQHLVKVLEFLDNLGIQYNLNSQLVRGLDYYNRTVFEVVMPSESAQRPLALGGGGRYDQLIESLGGRPTPACGFALGMERLLLYLDPNKVEVSQTRPDVFLAQLGDGPRLKSLQLFEELRQAGLTVHQAFTKNSLKSQLALANQLKVKYALIIGQKELLDGTILLRDMESGSQEVLDLKRVKSIMLKRLAKTK
ncbi:MAG TPA: histidine--tRNA ligase [Patescibacteria group bacterium]|nr:histidine--tRNA ligase [bacterium]HRT10996.1 histidine--tRNA ligase [Patescibacteria group bacterium]HRU89847.1 histidine--tRNA ligase [Patescibacteria group bacterium]